MIGLLMKFLPPEAKAAIELVQRLTAALDTPEERQAVMTYCMDMLRDNSVSATEWSKLGKALKIYGKK